MKGRQPFCFRQFLTVSVPMPSWMTSDRVSKLTSDVVSAIEERPYTSLAIAGGLAFAIGALWVLKRQQQQSSFERLRSQLPSFSGLMAVSTGRSFVRALGPRGDARRARRLREGEEHHGAAHCGHLAENY